MRYRRRTKAAALALFAALSVGISCGTASAACCPDISGHWAEQSIERWYETGLARGFEDGTFRPDSPMTRAQLATVLASLLALPEESTSPFSDVTPQDWFYPYLARCHGAGILAGDQNLAHPNELVTRQQAAVMLAKALKLDSVKELNLSEYSDESSIAPWAKSAMAACIQAGMMSGIGDGRLGPTQPLSRGALMTMLDRVVVQYIRSSGEYTLTDRSGVILVSAGNVSLRGKTEAKLILTHAAANGTITLEKGTAVGEIIRLSDEIDLLDLRTDPVAVEKPASGGGGGGGGHSTPSTGSAQDLTVSETGATVQSGTYRNVTVSDRIGDSEVVLDGLTIQGDLTIYGGGSNTVKLNNCIVKGTVILAKNGGQPPRLLLSHTPISHLRVTKHAILEGDAASVIAHADFTASVEVRGTDTMIREANFAARSEREPSLRMTGGTIRSLSVESRLELTGRGGSVEVLIPSVSTTVSSDLVEEIRLPEQARDITIQITGDGEVRLRSDGGTAQVTAESGRVAASATDDSRIQLHIHRWDTVISKAATCTESGVLDHICLTEDCPVLSSSEEIPPLGHVFSEAWSISEEGHAHRCTRCGDAMDAEGHRFLSDTPCDQPAVCSVCGYAKPAGQHIWEKGDDLTPATCIQAGTALFRCQSCGVTETRTDGAPLGHTWDAWTGFNADTHEHYCARCNEVEYQSHTVEVVIPGKGSTCTEPGYTEKTQCSVCNTTIRNSIEIPALGHDFGIGNYQSDRSGHWRICVRCEVAGESTDHSWPPGVGCDKVAKCQLCNFERAAGSHTFQFERTSKEPTCIKRGEAIYRCTACETEESRSEGEPVGHQWGDWTGVDTSSHQRTCSVCPASEQGSHTEITETEAVPATCTEDGRTAETVCSVCSYILERGTVTPKLGHDYIAGSYNRSLNGHSQTCTRTRCNLSTEESPHSYNIIDCTKPVNCTVCNWQREGGDHNFEVKEVISEATCTAPAYNLLYCTVCREEEPVEDGEPLGHLRAKYLEYDENQHMIICGRCDSFIENAPHQLNDGNCYFGQSCQFCGYTTPSKDHVSISDDKAATCTEPGVSGRIICNVCGSVLEEGSTVPALEHQWDSGTPGENSTIVFTCLRCNETYTEIKSDSDNIWFSYNEYGGIVLNWNAATGLSDDTYYAINGKNTYSQNTTLDNFSQLLRLLGFERNSDIEIGIMIPDPSNLLPPTFNELYKLENGLIVQQSESIPLNISWESGTCYVDCDELIMYYIISSTTENEILSIDQFGVLPYSVKPNEQINVATITAITCADSTNGKIPSITLHCTPTVTLTVPEIPAE